MRPELVVQLRARLAGSGLTPDQVRARLRAEGYPENLLDAYLVDASMDSTVHVNDAVLRAVQALGIVDSSETVLAAELRRRPAAAPIDTTALRARAGADTNAQNAPPADSGYTLFGFNVFQGATSQFDANAAGPVDASYRLGPGDQLVLILTGDVELAHTLDVTREGFVVIPQVGQLYVANLTLGQLEDLLYSRLARVYSGVRRRGTGTTRFSISVARLRSNQVFVVGDVLAPGSFRISSAGTALTALYAAGGPALSGSLRAVEVRRGGRTVSVLDVYDYLLRGDASQDVRLENSDIVFVPPYQARVRVVGEVIRPATYEIKPGETLTDVLRAAGGFTAHAARRRIQIERILPALQRSEPGRDRVVIDVASEQLTSGYGPAVPLEPGDVVRVYPISERVRNRITVAGNVWAPGSQGYTDGMRLSAALQKAGGLKPDTYLGQVLVSRLLSDSTRVQLRTALHDTSGTPVDDLVLHEDDEIQLFSLTEFRPQRYVAIAGAVRAGGRFPYREGMTMRDLVLLAGGLQESAYLKEAEIARLPENRAAGVTASTFRVPMDSTYLVERASHNGSRYLGPPGLPAPSSGAPEVPLQPYDNVLIMRQPDWELQRTVTVTGEVEFPGTYALITKTERLSDVLARAGGLTPEAYAGGVVFYRRDRRIGRIGVALPEVLTKESHRDNLTLLEGDSIFVPRYSGVVNVRGAVNSPVAVPHVPGRDLEYYVRAAGGPSRLADAARAYVTQPNGKVESRRSLLGLAQRNPEPGPGATVFVPEKDPTDRKDYTAIAGSVAQILASLVAILVVVTRR